MSKENEVPRIKSKSDKKRDARLEANITGNIPYCVEEVDEKKCVQFAYYDVKTKEGAFEGEVGEEPGNVILASIVNTEEFKNATKVCGGERPPYAIMYVNDAVHKPHKYIYDCEKREKNAIVPFIMKYDYIPAYQSRAPKAFLILDLTEEDPKLFTINSFEYNQDGRKGRLKAGTLEAKVKVRKPAVSVRKTVKISKEYSESPKASN